MTTAPGFQLVLRLLTLAAILFIIAGCTTAKTRESVGDSQSVSAGLSDPQPRQTDAQGRRLPFTTQFPNRWNRGNDGTTYEPCTAVTPQTLQSLGLDPSTVEDGASVDGQTARGCQWDALPPISDAVNLGQSVGNSKSLAAYKEKNRVAANWYPDITIENRRVGVMDQGAGGCLTYVQSGDSGIVTSVLSMGLQKIPLDEQCELAVKLTRATISQMPL